MSLRQDTAGERLLSRSDKADELLMTLTTARDVCRRLIRRGGSVTAPLSLSLSLPRARQLRPTMRDKVSPRRYRGLHLNATREH
jgi:hypothetical protein